MNPNLLTILSLWKRELVRFYRQPSRVLGAVGSPLIFWLLIGSGIGRSFRSADYSASMSYLEYFFPGTLLLILLFTSIFSTISLIQDRTEGFLQAVLVAPVSRFSIVLGKVLGGTTLAFLQGILFLLLAPLLGIPLTLTNLLGAAAILLLNAFALSALGFCVAWRFNSVQGFHAVMNLLLFPLWILSGALFPASGAAGWLSAVMSVNPLSYGLSALHHFIFSGLGSPSTGPSFSLSVTVVSFFGLAMFIFSAVSMSKQSERNLT